MANTIITKNSSTASAVPTAGDLVQGELAVNVTDKRLFTEDAGGNIVEIGTNPSTINIDAGTIDGTAIGGTTPTTGAFTTLSASTSVTSPSGLFTNLSASGSVTLSGGTANAVAFLNGSKVLTSGSALTFDGANLTLTHSNPFTPNATFVQTDSTGGVAFVKVQSNTAEIDLMSGGGTYAINYMGADEAGLVTQGADGMRFNVGGSYARWTFGASEQMRLTSTGLGIGTSSPAAKLVSAGSSATNFKALILRNGDGTTGSSASIDFETSPGTQGSEAAMAGRVAGLRTGSGTSGALTFSTTNNGVLEERARITSSGDLLVGTTSTTNGALINWYKASGTIETSLGGITTAQNHIVFANPNGNVGAIQVDGSATSYNTSSDYRLKEDIQPMSDASARVLALNPVNFAWKADGKRVDGFIAHEAQAVVPEAVTGEKDAVDAEGNPVYQGIDQSKLVPLLTAALQEALAEIKSLKDRLDAANI